MPGHRRSIRLHGYDYSRGGAYSVTICVDGGRCLFEGVGVRQMIQSTWDALPRHFPRVETDAFVVMPNHVHGILFLAPRFVAGRQTIDHAGTGDAGAEGAASSTPTALPKMEEGAASSTPTTLPVVVRAFKSISAIQINRVLGRRGRLWQRNYYERIIRNDDELHTIRGYIANNPRLWEMDRENPDRIGDNDIYDWLYS